MPTGSLDLRAVQPDFVCLSFYKTFGFPTGVSALIVRHEALAEMRRPWFAGGTIEWVATYEHSHARAGSGGCEDGTPNFFAFEAILDGLALLERIGMHNIEARVRQLTQRLLEGLIVLRHPNGAPRVAVYGPARSTLSPPERADPARGPTGR